MRNPAPTKPETLRKLGDGLTAASATLPAGERLKQIEAVTEQIVNLTNEAKKFDESSIAGEAERLREACRQMQEECQRRIKAVLDAVEIERKKTISIGTNKGERDGLTDQRVRPVLSRRLDAHEVLPRRDPLPVEVVAVPQEPVVPGRAGRAGHGGDRSP